MNTCVTWTEITLSGEAVHYNFVIKFCMYETIIDVCNKFIRTCTLSTNSHKSFRSSLRGYWDEWFRSPGVAIGDIPCVGLWVVRGRLTLSTDREWRVRGSVMISWHVEVGDLVDKDVGVRIVRGMTLAQIVIPWGFREKPGCIPGVFGCMSGILECLLRIQWCIPGILESIPRILEGMSEHEPAGLNLVSQSHH